MKWVCGLVIAVVMLAMPGVFVVFSVVVGGEQYQRAYNNSLCVSSVAQTATTGFRLPLTGRYRISSPYGMRLHPVSGGTKMHRGVDLSMIPHGGDVLSMGAGTVTRLSSGGAGGNIVTIDHGDGLVSKYMHLSRFAVVEGQQVGPGTRIGVEGATGAVTGPHLHWEVWVDGVSTDPVTWAAAHGLPLTGNAPPVAAAPVTAAASSPGDGAATAQPVVAAATPSASATTVATLPTVVGRWKGEQLSNAAQIILAGQALGLDSWTLTVGVMTAMGESSLVNVDRGDAAGPDSRGLFQQRANGAWGSYTDRMTPRIAATNFFRALVAVPGYHDLAPTEAAHRTQRNANPNYYARFWPEAVAVVAALTANPSLLISLPGVAASVGCVADSATAASSAGSPGAPAAECAASGRPAESGLSPAALHGMRCALAAFPKITRVLGVGDRAANPSSDHPKGRAVDYMIDGYRTPEGKAYGWQLARWTQANAKSLGVRYVIFDMKYWSAGSTNMDWKPYTKYGPNPGDTLGHRDHVHVSYD